MRYSFHGKNRFTGRTVDGFIEARNSSEAIDNLAEEGVIGVYSVCPDPAHDKPGMLVDSPRSLPAPEEPEHETITLIDKLSNLVGQVEQLLSEQLVSRLPTRTRRSTASKPVVADEQNAALRAIFQDNVDLRRNIKQLASAKSALKANEKSQLAVRETAARTINIPSQPAA